MTIPVEDENMEKEDETEEGELDPIVAQLRTIFFLPLPADVSARSGHLRNIFFSFFILPWYPVPFGKPLGQSLLEL